MTLGQSVTSHCCSCIFFGEYTHTHPFSGPFSGTTRVSRYQKGKTNLDFTEARDSEWQWHQLGHMQICTSLQPHNHASTPPLEEECWRISGTKIFICCPANSVKTLVWLTSCNKYVVANLLPLHKSIYGSANTTSNHRFTAIIQVNLH